MSVALYAVIWVAWARHWAGLDAVDRPALNALHAYGSQRTGWVTGWNIFCDVFSPSTFRIIALAVAAVALVRRRWGVAVFMVLSIGLSGPLSVLAKALTDRPRPGAALVSAPSSSLPSGHAVGVTVGVLALLVVFLPVLQGRTKAAVIAAGAVMIVTVGVARVILNVHHPSDVLAGWALGYAYFYLCLIVMRLVPANLSWR